MERVEFFSKLVLICADQPCILVDDDYICAARMQFLDIILCFPLLGSGKRRVFSPLLKFVLHIRMAIKLEDKRAGRQFSLCMQTLQYKELSERRLLLNVIAV